MTDNFENDSVISGKRLGRIKNYIIEEQLYLFHYNTPHSAKNQVSECEIPKWNSLRLQNRQILRQRLRIHSQNNDGLASALRFLTQGACNRKISKIVQKLVASVMQAVRRPTKDLHPKGGNPWRYHLQSRGLLRFISPPPLLFRELYPPPHQQTVDSSLING